MSRIGFNFGKYTIVLSNHGYYEIYEKNKRELYKKYWIDKKKLKELSINDASGFITSGSLQGGLVDSESVEELKKIARNRLYYRLANKKTLKQTLIKELKK